MFMETALQQLHSAIGLSFDKLNDLRSDLRLETIAVNQHFVEAGQACERLGFVTRGLFRFYYITYDGRDVTKSFCSENEFVGVYSAFLKNQPSPFSIEALEPSTVITFSFETLQRLSHQDVEWLGIRLHMVEQLYLKKEQRERQLLLHDAQSRYLGFCNSNPGLENRIKQYHIASYLGITSVSLSRIRSQLGLTGG